jgi:hypothetical protein
MRQRVRQAHLAAAPSVRTEWCLTRITSRPWSNRRALGLGPVGWEALQLLPLSYSTSFRPKRLIDNQESKCILLRAVFKGG